MFAQKAGVVLSEDVAKPGIALSNERMVTLLLSFGGVVFSSLGHDVGSLLFKLWVVKLNAACDEFFSQQFLF